jgi:serine/threonine protein kinase
MVEIIRPEPIDIPGYRFERWLGRGGMADVYLATQLSLGRSVAIKVLASERTPSEEVSARFEQEARIIARLDHPSIVGIFDVGRTPRGQLYYTMPYMPGGDLAARDLTQDQHGVIDVVRALCQALAYAHEQGVVHRDVKPENVLYDQLGHPRLADFGIALTSVVSTRVTKEGNTLGSVAYMSPEQARGKPVDRRSDIYSLGVVCYECLTGKLPFSGQDSMSVALAHVEQPIPRLSSARRHWQSFIDRAMAKKPDDRFQSAQEMLDALAALDRRMALVAPVSAIASTLAEMPQQIRRSWNVSAVTRAAGMIVLVSVLVSMTAYAIYHWRSSTSYEAPAAAQDSAPAVANSSDAPKAADVAERVPPPPEPAPDLTPAQTTDANVPPEPAAPVHAETGQVIHDRDGPEMIVVPAQVTHRGKTYDIAHAIALGRYEVTRGEYAEFARATGRPAAQCRQPLRVWSVFEKLSWRNPGFAQDDHHPVICVSWDDASAYAQWLSKRTHHRYRLPSQAEWLHAARLQPDSGSTCRRGNVYDASNRTLLHLASRFDCNDGFAQTAPVGHFEPGTLGIYDLIGNASEWTRDCAAKKSAKKSADGTPCEERIFRGTSWRDGTDRHNLEFSGSAAPDAAFTTVGFRLARELEDDAESTGSQ